MNAILKSPGVPRKWSLITERILLHRNYIHSTPTRSNNGISKYCFESVKKHDYENFLALLLIKDAKLKQQAFTIRAVNIELARVHDVTTETKIGSMRMKFWEDAVDRIYSDPPTAIPDHPVVKQLKIAVDEAKLSKHYLRRLVKARQRMGNLTFMTVKDIEDYCEESVSSVYYLMLDAAGIKNVHTDHAASHLGKAQGIANLLRSVKYQSRSKYCIPVPQEILMRHGVSQEKILRDQVEDKGVEEAVFEMATVAHQHLEKARSLHKQDFPPVVTELLLPAVAVERYLDRLRHSHFHVTDPKLQNRDHLLAYRYFMSRFRNRF